MSDTDIQLQENETKGRYIYRADDGTKAYMTFSKVGSSMIIIDHTEVQDALRGQRIGLKRVSRGVEDARAAGRKILPFSPFAAAQFLSRAKR